MTQKSKILKKWEKHLEVSSFYTCVPKIKIMITIYGFWNMVRDGRADGRTVIKRWHIEVGAPPKNKKNQLIKVDVILKTFGLDK